LTFVDEVVRKLGEGGFSLVVECFDRTNNSKVAIKIQRAKYYLDAQYEVDTLQRIEKEKKRYPEHPW
jgi:serine/threonine protein kinase